VPFKGLGVGIWLGLCFWTGMLTQEHVELAHITRIPYSKTALIVDMLKYID